MSTHKHLYLSTEEENGGEGDFTAKEGEDAERESPSSPDDSDSAEEQLPLEDHQVHTLPQRSVDPFMNETKRCATVVLLVLLESTSCVPSDPALSLQCAE